MEITRDFSIFVSAEGNYLDKTTNMGIWSYQWFSFVALLYRFGYKSGNWLCINSQLRLLVIKPATMKSILSCSFFLIQLGVQLATGAPLFGYGTSNLLGSRNGSQHVLRHQHPTPSSSSSTESDCNTSLDVFPISISACLPEFEDDFDPNRIPQILTKISCDISVTMSPFIYKGQNVGCDEIEYTMPVLRKDLRATSKRRTVYKPSWERIVVACIPAVWPRGVLERVTVDSLT